MGFEKFNLGHGSLEKKCRQEEEKREKEEKKKKEEELMMTRREFLDLAGRTAAMAGISGTALWNIFGNLADEKKEEEEQDVEPETEEQRKIAEENIKSIGEILDFKKEKIEINDKTIEEVKNYWKEKYTSEPLKNDFQKAYNEMGAWQPYLEKIFEEEFKEEPEAKKYLYLAIPESHWQLKAKSKKKAVGPYQFIRSTAKEYGLRADQTVDERKDPLKSGRACAKYLKDLFKTTGDWRLALSLYNGGFGRDYLKKVKEKNEPISYENYLAFLENEINQIKNEIKNNPDFNEEKGGKIFKDKISGFAENLNYPQKFDAVYELIEEKFVEEQKPPLEFEEERILQRKQKFYNFDVKKGDSYWKITKKFAVTEKQLKNQNPELRKRGLEAGMTLKIPQKIEFITLTTLARYKNCDVERLEILNPALKKETIIPDGYVIRV